MGDLAPVRYEQVAAHVEQCGDCQKRLGELGSPSDNFVEGLRRPLGNGDFDDEAGCASSISHAERLVETLARDGHRAGEFAGAPDETLPVFSSATGVPSPDAANEADRSDSAPAGLKQLGRYRLLEELGAGGMGTVYKALHTKLDRIVAVKVLNASRLGDLDAVARFEREMKVIGSLDHPHIVRATDADHADDVHFLVMEFVDGIDLSQLLRRLGPLPVAEACELIRQAALGLQYVHQHELVHRDIKPSNLMLAWAEKAEDGTQDKRNSAIRTPLPPSIKILDLGLALLDRGGGGDELTSTGQVMGTIDYMAPEQFEDTHGVDIRADIYSLGATLYKLLTGNAPFSGEKYRSSLEKVAALARADAPSVSTCRADLPAKLAATIDRMIKRDPAERLQTPGDVADVIAPFAKDADLVELWRQVQSVEDSDSSIDQTAMMSPKPDSAKRLRPSLAIIVAAAAAAALGIVLVVVWGVHHFSNPPGSDLAGPTAIGTPPDATSGADQSTTTSAVAETEAPTDRLPNGWRIGKPVNLGAPVNTESSDMHPTLSGDGLLIVFGSHRMEFPHALWTSTRENIDQAWSDPVRLDLTANGSTDVSADGLTLIISTTRPGGVGEGDLWISTRQSRDEPFGSPENLGAIVNSSENESGPCLPSDGLTLLFASDRPGGFGGSDIWMSTRPSIDESWSEAVNLGPVINGVESEGSPDVSADGLALVFESRREVSHGVGDLWMSTRTSIDEPWGEPVNLGAEVNTPTWDAGPEFAINDTVLFFSTRGLKDGDSRRDDADVWMVPIRRPVGTN
ncbi:MAG: protein kinase [Pirellulaceae bacterium]|nr:protein kinase [Pirellulaceae bacterium]